jgi:hypothetical protein
MGAHIVRRGRTAQQGAGGRVVLVDSAGEGLYWGIRKWPRPVAAAMRYACPRLIALTDCPAQYPAVFRRMRCWRVRCDAGSFGHADW